jgi:glutathione peroxidase
MYEFTMKDIDGNDVKLEKYKGSVVMLVNVASKCGLTPQYDGASGYIPKVQVRRFHCPGLPCE